MDPIILPPLREWDLEAWFCVGMLGMGALAVGILVGVLVLLYMWELGLGGPYR